jgi:hypothetical protein
MPKEHHLFLGEVSVSDCPFLKSNFEYEDKHAALVE